MRRADLRSLWIGVLFDEELLGFFLRGGLLWLFQRWVLLGFLCVGLFWFFLSGGLLGFFLSGEGCWDSSCWACWGWGSGFVLEAQSFLALPSPLSLLLFEFWIKSIGIYLLVWVFLGLGETIFSGAGEDYSTLAISGMSKMTLPWK